jgi:hypothetical protein
MKGQYDWIDLWSAFYWMRETFPFSIFNHEGALKNALLSHEVPARGKSPYLSAYQRIEKNITADTEFSVTSNTMRTSHEVPTRGKAYLSNTTVSFEAVQIDRRSFEEWIKSNAIEHSEAPTAAAKARAAKLDANDEHELRVYLTGLLRANPDMGRDNTWWECRLKFPQLSEHLSERKFFRRILPDARDAAGLPRKARPGPRAKRAL